VVEADAGQAAGTGTANADAIIRSQ
jgi:hypothetical protein